MRRKRGRFVALMQGFHRGARLGWLGICCTFTSVSIENTPGTNQPTKHCLNTSYHHLRHPVQSKRGGWRRDENTGEERGEWVELQKELQVGCGTAGFEDEGFMACMGNWGEGGGSERMLSIPSCATFSRQRTPTYSHARIHNRTRAEGAGEDLGRVVAAEGGGGWGVLVHMLRSHTYTHSAVFHFYLWEQWESSATLNLAAIKSLTEF